MKYMKIIFRAIIGLIFGVVSAITLSPALAAFVDTDSGSNQPPIYLAYVIVAIMVLLAIMAPTIRRTFGRGFLLLSVCLFFLPISTLLVSGRAANDVMTTSAAEDEAAAAIGAGIGAMALTGAATFFGLILGGICLIIGLILALGGRREVVVVKEG